MRTTRLVAIDRRQPDPRVLADAVADLQAGRLVAFPTDTVYGLGCDATNEQALQDLYQAKDRPSHLPLIVLLPEPQHLARYSPAVPPLAWQAAKRFWPGPLTIIVPALGTLSRILTGGGDTIGLRLPRDPVARALAAALPLASTSANLSGRPAPRTAAEVMEQLGGRIDLVLDAGPVAGEPSTVVDFSVSPPALLRPGPITPAALQEALGELQLPPPSPL